MNTAVTAITELWSTIALWSNSNLGNQPSARSALIKDLYIWIKEVRRILGTYVFLGKRPLGRVCPGCERHQYRLPQFPLLHQQRTLNITIRSFSLRLVLLEAREVTHR